MSGPERPSSLVTRDQDALRTLIGIHAVPEPRILDVTFNLGRMWRGLDYAVHRMDRNPAFELDTVASFANMPFPPGSFDVVVFDPPHMTESGKAMAEDRQGYMRGWHERYGTRGEGLDAVNISHLYPGFLSEAKRVLQPVTGIVLAKIADQVHRGAYQWQQVDFVLAARMLGMTPCDMLIKARRVGPNFPGWRHIYHTRRAHSYWICVRNGDACIRPEIRPQASLPLWEYTA